MRREDTNAAILNQGQDGCLDQGDRAAHRIAGALSARCREVSGPMCSGCARARSNTTLPWLDAQWAAGRRNGAELWRCLKVRGFLGSVWVELRYQA